MNWSRQIKATNFGLTGSGEESGVGEGEGVGGGEMKFLSGPPLSSKGNQTLPLLSSDYLWPEWQHGEGVAWPGKGAGLGREAFYSKSIERQFDKKYHRYMCLWRQDRKTIYTLRNLCFCTDKTFQMYIRLRSVETNAINRYHISI